MLVTTKEELVNPLGFLYILNIRKKLLTGTVQVNNFLLTGTVPVNNSLLTGTLSNVRGCWLAMPLGAGILRWVLACRTILHTLTS